MHVSLLFFLFFFFFFPTNRSAFGIFWSRDSSWRRRPIQDFLISNERYSQGEENQWFGGKIFTRWFPRRETNSPFFSLFMYLLLQEWFNPGNFDILSKLGTGRREFLILVGKFQLVDSLWGKTFPHYKHERRSNYLLREIPVKNRESLGRGSTHGKIVG